jgi:hypothetical protein
MLSASAEGTSERKAVKKIVAGTRLLIVLSLDGADFWVRRTGPVVFGNAAIPKLREAERKCLNPGQCADLK